MGKHNPYFWLLPSLWQTLPSESFHKDGSRLGAEEKQSPSRRHPGAPQQCGSAGVGGTACVDRARPLCAACAYLRGPFPTQRRMLGQPVSPSNSSGLYAHCLRSCGCPENPSKAGSGSLTRSTQSVVPWKVTSERSQLSPGLEGPVLSQHLHPQPGGLRHGCACFPRVVWV